ncbi:MAG: diacylglycerol kinase family lipid kinase [Anaerolineales bacterium]|jgi:YegS/Rv2252/BmrU family lipid kinase
MNEKTLIVLNPVAGQQDVSTVRAAIEQAYKARGMAFDLYVTAGNASDKQRLQEALYEGYTTLVAAGGDGTVAEVAHVLVNTDIALGILPTGTGNGVARAMSVPLDLKAALELITGGHALHPIDAMKIKDQHHFLQIGAGLSGEAMEHVELDVKHRMGRLYYVWTGLKAFFGYQPHRLSIWIDDQRVDTKASEVLLVNCGTLGSPYIHWGEANPIDGVLDLFVVRTRTILDILRFAWHAILGQQQRDPKVTYFKARDSVRIQADHALALQCDGDYCGRTPVEVDLIPQAVQIIVPQDFSGAS